MPRAFSYRYVRPPDRISVFHATLLVETDRNLVLTHSVNPPRPMLQDGKPVLVDGSSIVWFLFNNRPFDIGRFYLPDGQWTGYYVDLTENVHWSGANAETLRPVVDLFLDVWITPAGAATVLDEDELQAAEQSGWITGDQASQARSVCEKILSRVNKGVFPPAIVRQWDGGTCDAAPP